MVCFRNNCFIFVASNKTWILFFLDLPGLTLVNLKKKGGRVSKANYNTYYQNATN